MAKQNVLEMLRRPLTQKPASSSPNLEHANELVTAFGKMQQVIAEKDEQITSMQRTIDHLTRQSTGAREKVALPEIHFEITGRDMNGHIKTLKAVPR